MKSLPVAQLMGLLDPAGQYDPTNINNMHMRHSRQYDLLKLKLPAGHVTGYTEPLEQYDPKGKS